jgi:hypothetical protein
MKLMDGILQQDQLEVVPPVSAAGWQRAAVAGAVVANFVSVFFVARYLFGMNERGLFYGFDGEHSSTLIHQYAGFVGTVTGFASDLIRGLGNVVFPLDPEWFPSYLLPVARSGAFADYPLCYAVAATELFAASVLTGLIVGFRPIVALAAAWTIFFATWQIAGPPPIENLWRFLPQEGEMLAVGCIVSAMLLRLGRGGLAQGFAITAAGFGTILLMAVAAPGDLLQCLPGWCAFAAAPFFVRPTRREVTIRLACATVLCVAVFSTGLFSYLHGLFGYTAANIFPALSERPRAFWGGEVSLLFETPIGWNKLADTLRQLFTPMRILIGGGLIGAIYALYTGPLYVRRMACGVLLLEAVYLLIGVTNYLVTFWYAPSISYFEMFSFPYFALTLCYLVLQLLWHRLSSLAHIRAVLHLSTLPWGATLGVLLAILPWTVAATLGEVAQRDASDNYPYSSSYRESDTEITRLLRHEIALRPGEAFRGREVTATGRTLPAEKDWRVYSNIDNLALLATGNYHDGPGLWQDAIPTLLEYGAYKSPAYFVIMRRFFTAPDDIVIRNVVGVRQIDQRMLRLLGVRFIITDLPIDGAQEQIKLPIAVSEQTRERYRWVRELHDPLNLYLYELAEPNLGQFSPTEIRVAQSADAILTQLSDPKLDPARVAVTSAPLPEGLVAASLDTLTVGKGEISVRAHSTGTSLLVLPFEFSNCLRLQARESNGSIRLLRVDMALTGVLFDRDLDTTLSYFTGPFSNSGCRLEDVAELKSLDISHAFASAPAFGVLGQVGR